MRKTPSLGRFAAKTMIAFEFPEGVDDLNEYDHCPNCNHPIIDGVYGDERAVHCSNCDWIAIELLPRIRISR